jgi:hypothetical protein
MKNMSALLVFVFILVLGAIKAYALLLPGPNVLYLPHPVVISKPVDILPRGPATIGAGERIYHKKVIKKQQYVEVLPSDGATIFIESYPVELKK